MPKMPPLLDTGVYIIRCLKNKKVYVGSAAKSLKRRIWWHQGRLRTGVHYNAHLQRAWDKYGEEAFEFEVVERCHPDRCLEREQHWINSLGACDRKKGFNVCPTAGNCFGKRNSEQVRKRMSDSAKLRHKNYRHPWVGRKHTEETRAKMSATHRGGKLIAKETRAKIAAVKRAQSLRRIPEDSRVEIRSRYIPRDAKNGLTVLAKEFNVSSTVIRNILDE